MSLKLYWNKICPFVQRSWIAALEKNVPVEYVYIPLDDMPQWYIKDVNSRATIPSLATEDGTIVFESMFIAQYLDERFEPKNSLNPGDAYVQHRVSFFISQIGDLIGNLYGLVRASKEELASQTQDVIRDLRYVESILKEQSEGPFFLGTTFSLADIAIVPFLARFSALLSTYSGFNLFENAPRLKALYNAALLRPSVAASTMPAEFYIASYVGYANGKEAAPRTYKFFTNERCPYAERTRITLALKKVPNVEFITIDLGKVPSWYAAINPRMTVPTLQLPDGRYVHESQLIAEYLAAEFESGTDVRATTTEERAHGRFFADNAGNFTGAMYGFFRGKKAEEVKADLKEQAVELERLLNKSNAKGPFLFPSGVTLYDIAFIPFLHRFACSATELLGGWDFFGEYPRLKAFLDGARNDAVIGKELADKEVYMTILRERLQAAKQ